MSGAREADKLCHVLEILPDYVLLPFRHDGQVAHAVSEQPLTSTRVVQHVDYGEVDALFRKKLFRSEAAASPGLGEEREALGGFHGVDWCKWQG